MLKGVNSALLREGAILAEGKVIPFADPSAIQPDARKMPMARRRTVVQFGRDAYLLGLRARVINSVGFDVASAPPENLQVQLADSQSARIWIFCHSLAFHEFLALAAAIRRERPTDKLLRLKGLDEGAVPDQLVDHCLEPPTTVDDFLRVVTSFD
jgi:hypothetical protein